MSPAEYTASVRAFHKSIIYNGAVVEDTFKTSRIGSKNCKQSTAGRCQNGQVELGMNNIVTSSNYADAAGITIKDGCCDCGGGSGGQQGSGVGLGYQGQRLGATYGGGGGGGGSQFSAPPYHWYNGADGGHGAVRIIWGTGRLFPSTNTADA